MSADLTGEIAAFAAKVQQEAADLAYRARQAPAPAGTIPHPFLDYLTLAPDMLADLARYVGREGLHITPEPADLDTADPTIDAYLKQLATAGA